VAGAEPVPTGNRTLHSEHSYVEDGDREYQIDDLTLQAVQEYGENRAGQQNSKYEPRRVQPIFVPPPPPPPPPPPQPPASSISLHVPPPHPAVAGNVLDLAPNAARDADAQKLDRDQEELRDCREELLGSRFKLAALRKQLRDLHIETSAKEGSALNLLRQYLNDSPTSRLPEIEKAFEEASAMRDQVGLLESTYDTAEANYNTLEWNYTSKEARFVEGALSNKLVPIGTVSRSRSADDLNITQLTYGISDRTEKSREAWNHTMYCEMSNPGGNALAQTKTAQQAEAMGKEEQTFSGNTPNDSDHASVSPIGCGIQTSQKKQEHKRWLRKMKRIDAWLLETVADSRLHQLYLKAIFDVDCTDEDAWWIRTSQLLTESREELPLFRTGDSTVSNQTTSKPHFPRTVDATRQDMPTLDIISSTSLVSDNRPTVQPPIPRSEDLLHVGGRDFATLKPPTRSVSGSPVSYMTSELPSRRTSCTNTADTAGTADTADTQSDATSQDSDTGGIRLDCRARLGDVDDPQNHQDRSRIAESIRTTPTRQRQRNSTSSTSGSSHHSDNAYALQPGPAPDSAILTSRLESLPTPPNQFSSPEDCSIASEAGTASGDSQTLQREQVFARTEEPSPNVSCIAHTQPESSGCLVI